MSVVLTTDHNDTFQLTISSKSRNKKTTYAMKTPRVVALPVIYGGEYIIESL